MICNVRCTLIKCADLPLNPPIITCVIGKFCVNVCFHKFVFCGKHCKDMKEAAFNYNMESSEELMV
jgi:hypothetical protein